MKKTKYLSEAEKLANNLIDLSSGLDLPLEYTDLTSGSMQGNVMVDDFGDYLPFMFWLGELTDKRFKSWAEKKAKLTIDKYQMPNGLFCTSFRKKGMFPKKSNFKTFDADKMSDTSLGVNLLHDLTKDDSFKESLSKFFIGLEKTMTSKKGFIYYKSTPLFKIPFSMGKYCGLYIEELSKLYEKTKDKKQLNYAIKLSSPWINNSFFNKHGLFPFICMNPLIKLPSEILFRKKTSFTFDTAMLSKSNTNLIFGLTRLYRITKNKKLGNALDNWVDSIESNILTDNDVCLSIWNPKRTYDLIYLGADHAAVDSLLEIYLSTKNKKSLKLAEKITKGWLNYQSKEGIIQETPIKYNTSKISKLMKNYSMTSPGISRLDSQTDFAIMVLKIYELTKNKKYLTSAKKITEGILHSHKYKKGFAEFVEIKNKSIKGRKIETKFLFLLIKLLVLMDQVIKGKKIYKDSKIKDIIRDR